MKRIIIAIVAILLTTVPLQAQPGGNSERVHQLMTIISQSQTTDISAELNELIDIYRQTYGSNSPQFADALMQAALLCSNHGDNRQGMRLLRHSDRIFTLYGNGSFAGRDTTQQIFRHDICSNLYYNSGAESRALRLAKQSLRLKKAYFGENSEVYLNELLNISRLYAERLAYKKSNRYHNMGYQAYVELLKKEFCSTSVSRTTLLMM